MGEETLLVLPLDVVVELVVVLGEMMAKCLVFLLEIHHGPIVSNKMLENRMADLYALLDREVGRLRDITGTNLAGLRHLIHLAEEKKDVQMFVDATQRVR